VNIKRYLMKSKSYKNNGSKFHLSRKVIFLLIILIFAYSVIWMALNPSNNIIEFDGTIKYIELEGGFYGIVDNNGNRYYPINLPEEYKIDGLNVHVKARIRRDIASIHMWGITIEIIGIYKL